MAMWRGAPSTVQATYGGSDDVPVPPDDVSLVNAVSGLSLSTSTVSTITAGSESTYQGSDDNSFANAVPVPLDDVPFVNAAPVLVALDGFTTPDELACWKRCFGYTDGEVHRGIWAHRAYGADVHDETWEEDRELAERLGHTRNSWVHKYVCGGGGERGLFDMQPPEDYDPKDMWPERYVSLRGVLFDEEQVRKYSGTHRAKLTRIKSRSWRTSEDTPGVEFIALHNCEYVFLQSKLPECFHAQLEFHPEKLPAVKVLSMHAMAPNLGPDHTSWDMWRYGGKRRWPNEVPRPTQNEYPVFYFLYGDLANRQRLAAVLKLKVIPPIDLARALGAKLMLWGAKKALIDGGENDRIAGITYRIESKEDEMRLLVHETSKYEVVRCNAFSMKLGQIIRTLTFRFRNEERHLLHELKPSLDLGGV